MNTSLAFYKSKRPLTVEELEIVTTCFNGTMPKTDMDIDDLIDNEEISLKYIHLETESKDEEVIGVFTRDGWTTL
mgnify:CR=1 FL=1